MPRKRPKPVPLTPRVESPPLPVRLAYDQHGAAGFYAKRGAHYQNPHEPIVRRILALAHHEWRLPLARVLDLACGTGEATLALQPFSAGEFIGCDPYLSERYRQRTGSTAWEHSFETIAAGALVGEQFSLVVCSFALHLLAPSRLPVLLSRLSDCTSRLLIVTPHKRPHITAAFGWQLEGELLEDRVRARYYHSLRALGS